MVVLPERCAVMSASVGEPLVATAAENVRVWIAIEVRDVWAPKVLRSEGISAEVRAHLESTEANIEGARVQFIRKAGRQSGPLTVLVGVAGAAGKQVEQGKPHNQDAQAGDVLCEAFVRDLSAVSKLDFGSLVEHITNAPGTEALPSPWQRASEPAVLVCAHGKRDRCCGELGAALYRALRVHEGVRVWQTSHVGGHRFAPCVVTLPNGACYGRVTADHAEELVAAVSRNELFSLDHLRGLARYDAELQAADVFVRRELGLMLVDVLRVERAASTDEGKLAARWVVCGEDGANNTSCVRTGTVTMQRATSTTNDGLHVVQRPKSCGEPHADVTALKQTSFVSNT